MENNAKDGLTLDKLRVQMEPMLNHICIVFDTDVGRLVGVLEDDHDLYYLVDTIACKRTPYSAVGHVFSLKDRIPENRYAAMDDMHTANGCPAVAAMIVELPEISTADTRLANAILRYLNPVADNAVVNRVADIIRRFREDYQVFDLVAHMHRQRAFSMDAFGPGERTAGVLDHIRKELMEIEAAPDDLTEWVDVVLLALDGAWRAGHEPEAIARAIADKQRRNERRTWPDWRTAEAGKATEHVRE
ncbi:MAG: dATP/dGTP pyrophosphohydrolase domain-containing protein [Acidithiobacillus sp.]